MSRPFSYSGGRIGKSLSTPSLQKQKFLKEQFYKMTTNAPSTPPNEGHTTNAFVLLFLQPVGTSSLHFL